MAEHDDLDRWLDEGGPDAAARIAAWVGDDPARRRELLRRAQFQRDLADLVRSRAARVRRGPRRRVRVRWLALAAGLAAVAVAAGALARGRGAADVPRWRGGAATGGVVAQEGDVLVWPDGSRIAPEAGSELVLAAAAPPELRSGRLVAEVVPRATPFTVRAGGGEVTVLGTRFAVEAGADGAGVQVAEGRVRVTAGGGTVELAVDGAADLRGGRVRALPALRWEPALDPAWQGTAVAGGLAEVAHAADSGRLGLPIRWIASPVAASGHATVDLQGTLALELAVDAPGEASATLVLAEAADPAWWRCNLQTTVRLDRPGRHAVRIALPDMRVLEGAAPAMRHGAVLRQASLVTGGAPFGLRLLRLRLAPAQ